MGVGKLPYPNVKPTTTMILNINTGMGVSGSQNFKTLTEKGFYFERSVWSQNAEGLKVESKGLIILYKNIFPELETLTGDVVIGGTKHDIIVGKRLKNPDGTVHHVELELR